MRFASVSNASVTVGSSFLGSASSLAFLALSPPSAMLVVAAEVEASGATGVGEICLFFGLEALLETVGVEATALPPKLAKR